MFGGYQRQLARLDAVEKLFQLSQVHFIVIKIELEDIRLLIMTKDAQLRSLANFPDRRSLFAHKLAGTRRDQLHEVQMEISMSARGEAQEKTCRIFYVDLQLADSRSHAKHLGGLTEKPKKIINFVRGVEDDATPEFAPRRVTLPVILPWAPVGQVLSDFRARPKYAPNRVFFHNLF